MDDRHIEHAIFTSTSGSNRQIISQSSPWEEGNYGGTLSMLKSVHENVASDGDAQLADDSCSSEVDPNYWSCKNITQTKHEHQSDISRQFDGVEEAKVAADELLQRTNLGEKTGVTSPLSVKEKRRIRWHLIRYNMECHSRLNGTEEAEVFTAKFPKRTNLGKNGEISYSVSKEEKERETTANKRFPSYQNDASSQRFSGPLSRKTLEARRPMKNIVGERDNENATEESLVMPTQGKVNEEVSVQSHKASRTMQNIALERNQEIEKEESFVIPTRINVNEEVSPYAVTSPPIDGPNCYSLQFQAQAAVVPTWRGRFNIVNKNDYTFEGFVAHLSRTACQPAIEEARLLPALLQLEMVPKSIVWPKIFQTTKPTDYHIALYMLPSDRRYEKHFDLLVDYMSRHELAMRTFTKNAELLIFSSTELEMQYWRFQNKYYIWGVFRGKI